MKKNLMGMLVILIIYFVSSFLGSVAMAKESPYKGTTITAVLVTGFPGKALREDLIPLFEKETGIKVNAISMDYTGLKEKVMMEFLAGSGVYDAIMFETAWRGRWSPFIEDLDTYLNNPKLVDPEYNVKDILPGTQAMGIWAGKRAALPYRSMARMLYYRKDLFKKYGIGRPPETLEELRKVAQKLTIDTDGDGTPDICGFALFGKQGPSNAYEWCSFLFSSGGQLWDEKGNVLFNNEAGIYALTWYTDLHRKYRATPPECIEWVGGDQLITGGQKGRYAMTVMHTPYATMLEDPKVSKTVGLWDWAQCPGRTSLKDSKTPVGGWVFGISRDSKRKEAAFKFVEFITNKKSQIMSAFNYNGPCRYSSFEDPEVLKMWVWAPVVKEALARGQVMPGDPEWEEAHTVLQVAVNGALLGIKTPKQALDEAAEKVKQIFGKK